MVAPTKRMEFGSINWNLYLFEVIMKEKKRPIEEAWQEAQTYQTGAVDPPKSHRGLIAFLLALVIFLCGISTALGLMNIRLFRQLTAAPEESQTDCAVAVSKAPVTGAPAQEEEYIRFSPGFTGQSVTDFWQHYYDLPQGVYVSQVDQGSAAALCGLLPGDVLTHFDGAPISNTDTLQTLLGEYGVGQQLQLQLFRQGQHMTLTLTIT